jgi:iron complex outermembrane receptor protein
MALYSQATYTLTDQLRLTGGFRYTWDHTGTVGQQYAYQYPIPPGNLGGYFLSAPLGFFCTNPDSSYPACQVSYKEKSSAPTWLIDLDYKPINNMLAYAKYSRGYRAGGLSPTIPSQYATYNPEKLDAYEAGLKTSFHGAVSGSLNIAGFYNDFHNEQTMVSFYPYAAGTLPEQSGTVNAIKSQSYGAEVEGSLSPFRGFTLDVSYSYVNAKVLDIPPVATAPGSLYYAVSAAQSGDPEEYSPKNKYSINGNYILPIDASVGKISVGATFTHIDSQVSQYADRNADGSLGPYSILDARNLVDLNLSWNAIEGSPVDLSLFATNVTNDKYYTVKSGLYTSTGFDTASVGPPRMYGARLKVRFGR